jgi:hypothetical protein
MVDDAVVHYLPIAQYSTLSPPDVFVAWRYFISLSLVDSNPFIRPNQIHQRKTKRILWLHDLLEEIHLPSEAASLVPPLPSSFFDRPQCDMIIVPSQYHQKSLTDRFPSSLIKILPHGLNENMLRQASPALSRMRHSDVFIYARCSPHSHLLTQLFLSSPLRGLMLLLYDWRMIRKKIPTARLDIYYGFR